MLNNKELNDELTLSYHGINESLSLFLVVRLDPYLPMIINASNPRILRYVVHKSDTIGTAEQKCLEHHGHAIETQKWMLIRKKLDDNC